VRVLFICIFTLYAGAVFAWGERGHRAITEAAALRFHDSLSKQESTELERAAGHFIRDRRYELAHLSNIPDISWRERDRFPLVAMAGDPNHYINAEHFLGEPPAEGTAEYSVYLKKMAELPAIYEVLLKQYEGTPSRLDKSNKALFIFREVGTAPWRGQQLFDLAVEALKCAAQKENPKTPIKGRFDLYSQLKLERKEMRSLGNIDAHRYQCFTSAVRANDLVMATAALGILSHYIGDLAQPYHTTVDYDGWHTGNGGIHRYFETDVVGAIGPQFELEIFEAASKGLSLKEELLKNTKWKETADVIREENGVARLLLLLTANSYSKITEVRAIDDRLSKKKSAKLAWGESPSIGLKGETPQMERLPPSDGRVQKAFGPLSIQRILLGSYILSELWKAAWISAGKPNLSRVDPKTKKFTYLPYSFDFPFIWPVYDRPALKRIIKDF